MDDKTKNALLTAGSVVLGLLGLATAGIATAAGASSPKRNPSWKGPSWRDFIRGEWWLLDGEELFADQGIGDDGHESLAIDYMLDKDALVSGLVEHWEGLLDSEDEDVATVAEQKLQEIENYDLESDEYNAGNVYALVSVPDEVGVAAVAARSATSDASAEQIWEDINELGAREAFAKHYGAVMAHDRDFTAWKVDDEVLERIREFILGQASEQGAGEPDDPDTEIGIEEASTNRTAYIPVARFLTIRHPRDLWDPNVETQELWDSVTKDRNEQKP